MLSRNDEHSFKNSEQGFLYFISFQYMKQRKVFNCDLEFGKFAGGLVQEVHFRRLDDKNEAIDVKYYHDVGGLEEELHKHEYRAFNDVSDADANMLEIGDIARTTFGSAKVKRAER